jgi:cell division protein FtsB
MPLPVPQTPPQRPVSDDEGRRLCAALAPLQALDADLRAVALDASGGPSTRDPDAKRVAQCSGDAVARARIAGRRMARVPRDERLTLMEVAAVAHAQFSAWELARYLATRVHRDLDAEDARETAGASLVAAEAEHTLASLRYDVLASKGRLAPVALAAHRARGAAADRRDAALTAERGAEAAVAEHGMRLLRAAVDAWERTEE